MERNISPGLATGHQRRELTPPGPGRTIVLVNGFGSLRFVPERCLPLLGLACLLTACGGSGGSGTSPNAPSIANLRVSYSPPSPALGQATQISFIVDVVDPDGDWVGGSCRFTSGSGDLPIQPSGLPANATSGTAVCILAEAFGNSTVQVDLAVVDRAGHLSNILSGLVNIERPSRP